MKLTFEIKETRTFMKSESIIRQLVKELKKSHYLVARPRMLRGSSLWSRMMSISVHVNDVVGQYVLEMIINGQKCQIVHDLFVDQQLSDINHKSSSIRLETMNMYISVISYISYPMFF